MRRAPALIAAAATALASLVTPRVAAQGGARQAFPGVLDEHPAIQYAARPVRDRVADLAARVSRGRSALAFDEHVGYLRAVLRALAVPEESQLLVFSKTGVQRRATGPRHPRALYFNDSVVVGYIAGAPVLEIAAHDPEQGTVFYTIEQRAAAPAITRQTACLSCHVSASTLEVPGLINRSNVLNAEGEVLPMLGSHTVTHRTPLAQRWGGWFVTGSYVAPPYAGFGHMGNATVTVHPTSGPAITSNEVFISWAGSAPGRREYLSADSDIAALMLFDHQAHAVNLLTRLNWETRVAEAEQRIDFARGPLHDLVAETVDYFLFVDEAPPPARLTPRRGFAEAFAAGARRDRRGRSLRDLDLDTRLLRYRCSYMIDTAAFAALPARARTAVYARLRAILAGDGADPRYEHLPRAERDAILEILHDTHDTHGGQVTRNR